MEKKAIIRRKKISREKKYVAGKYKHNKFVRLITYKTSIEIKAQKQ